MAEALCRELGIALLAIDGDRLLTSEHATFETGMRLARREAILQGAALYWDGFDILLADEKRVLRMLLIEELARCPGVSFLAGDIAWEPINSPDNVSFLRIEFPAPTYPERIKLWSASLSHAPGGKKLELETIASKFRLSTGQIKDAAATARNLARWRDPENGQISQDDLYAACRLQSNTKLASLAQKIATKYNWEDIVLPPDTKEQLKQICNYVKYRSVVYDDWGFDHKLSLGKGVYAVFAGPSGTGKTMATEVIANELGLDLYKIDLSSVVSKYIGETEKNLARIFTEAETSNAILFFDEADALFGKRSQGVFL